MALLGKPNIARLESKGNAKGLMRALSHADPATRSQAALALGRLRAPEAVGPLISAMLDDHNSVAVMATQALGEIGEPAAVEALVVMLGNAVPERRVAALRALGQIGNEPAIDGIAGVLRGSHTDLDEHAIAALARLGPERLPRLLTLLEDSDQRVADAAAAALRQMGAPAQAALEAQAQAKATADAERAVRALGRLRTPAALASLVTMLHTGAYTTRTVAQEALLSAGTSCIAPLEAAIAGSDLNQQRAAVQALGASALPEAVPVLAQVVIDGAKPLARAAIQALGALSQAAAAPTLLDTLDSDDWLLRQHAADGLGRLTLDADGKARLAERLYDGTAAVRKAALQSLEAIKWRPSTPDEQAVYHVAKQNWAALRRSGAAAVPALARMVPLLLGGDRTEAVAAMAAAGPAALEPLIALLSHSDVATRAAAAEGLGALGDARAVPALIAELERGDSSNSGAAAATALGTLGAAEAADALEQAVRQGNATVRAAAAGALAHLGAGGERALLGFAASDNAYIVRAAIAGLGQLRSSAAAERLLDLALDERPEVQQEAIAAAVGLGAVAIPAAGARLRRGDRAARLVMADLLGHLGEHRAADALIRALWHSDQDTGLAAARALEMLGVPQLDERFGGDRVATLYALTLARVELDDSERHWLEGEALGDLAAANPALDTVHARVASGALPLVSDSAVVGPFGHSLVSMQSLFKAWLLGRHVTLPAWDGWFYHRAIALEDEQSPHVVVLCYYRPSA